ncbi:MAG TPA: roadblock/LC7 domain-containing protein [Coriobacteriia bacterium]|nr:roadblock/LC7 domain-containing protein [Coriobacteriia bacterium]
MVDDVFGELFMDDDAEEQSVPVPIVPPVTPPVAVPLALADSDLEADAGQVDVASMPVALVAPVAEPVAPAVAPVVSAAPVAPIPQPARTDRERRLADALNALMQENHDVEAAALVSLDGFPMASALPDGIQEDRVGAMSAAILGLGERAAAELGRGKLSQVFIEGEDGYVLLMAAGDRAVLTCLADRRAKLGLTIFDMRRTAGEIGEILG